MTARDAVVLLFTCTLRSAAFLATAAVVCRLMHQQSAALRHVVWTAAIVGSLVLPFAVVQFDQLVPPVAEVADSPMGRAVLLATGSREARGETMTKQVFGSTG